MTTRRTIQAPVERVWALATDIPGSADTISGIQRIEMLSEGEFGVGTRWRETRTMFGREATEEMWVSGVEPGSSYTVEAESHGTRYISTFTFTPHGDRATDVALTFSGEAQGAVPRMLAKVTAPLANKAVRKALRQDLDDLAGAAETSSAS